MKEKYVDYDKYESILREQRDDRIKSLERLIPEMLERRNRHFTRRMLITLIVVFGITIHVLHLTLLASAPLGMLLLLSLVSTFGLVFISYVISSFTFLNACHKALVIEKMITEYYLLTKGYDDSIDWLIEIGKLRDFI